MSRATSPVYVFVLCLGMVLVAPAVVVALVSLSPETGLHFPPTGVSGRWYASFFQDQLWTDSALVSLTVALLATVVATTLGTLAALGLLRGQYPARALVNGVVLGPLIVPSIVVAVGMYLQYTAWGLTGSLLGLVAAHASLSVPFVIINVGASLRNLDPGLELAAQTLGAGPVRTFQRVTLPLILPGVVAGAIIAFVLSWDEVVVAIFLSSPFVRTLPAVMWAEIHSRVDPTSAAVATMLAVVPLIVLPATMWVRRRAPGAS
jgi:putative spermidine/putrescine transport system permease protein